MKGYFSIGQILLFHFMYLYFLAEVPILVCGNKLEYFFLLLMPCRTPARKSMETYWKRTGRGWKKESAFFQTMEDETKEVYVSENSPGQDGGDWRSRSEQT